MFQQLFKRSHAMQRQLSGPLLEERVRYLKYCAEQGYLPTTLRRMALYQLIVIKYLRLDKKRRVTPQEVETAAIRWMRHQVSHHRLKGGCRRLGKGRFLWCAVNWLRYLGRLKTPPAPSTLPEVVAFGEYMRQERGLSEATIRYRCRDVHRFLDQIRRHRRTLAELTIPQIEAILVRQFSHGKYSPRTIQTLVSTLRAFFRYAESRRWCSPTLAAALKAPRTYRHATLPSSPTWGEVKRLIRTTRGSSCADIRDRAILLLLALYGLRASEVTRLCLDDLDWKQGILRLTRSKGGRPQLFPLHPSVGQALLRYLQETRPPCRHRQVFVTVRAPIVPLDQLALTAIVGRRWKPLNVPIRHRGPHSLRHACATRLMNQGVPLKNIADHLGHRNLETTRIYAKVDLPRLREVARFSLGGLR